MSTSYELDDITMVETTSNLMNQIKGHVSKLLELRRQLAKAEDAYKKAKDEYSRFSRQVLPDIFKLNGLDGLQTDDGTVVRIITKTECSINKNDADKNKVAKWLREHGAEQLVKTECHVPSSQVSKLKENNIIYEETMSMNTNSVKAFIIDQLGQKGNPAMITKEDLPQGLHFFQFDEVEVVV